MRDGIFLFSPSGGAVQFRQSTITNLSKIQWVSVKPNKMNTKQNVKAPGWESG